MPNPRHLIWDWNGTLLDDVDLCLEALNGLLTRRARPPIDAAYYRQHFTFPVVRFYEHLGFDLAAEPFADLSVEFIQAYEARRLDCALFPRTQEVLTAATTAGLTMSIISAYHRASLAEIIAHHALGDHFESLEGLDNIYAHGKHDLAAAWLQRTGYAAETCLFIGDTCHDYEVASSLGIPCLLVAHGHQHAARLKATGAPVVADLQAVATYLRLSAPTD